MNHSSLFSFEESSAWDPKVIRKYLVVPEHQLTILNAIPGWARVQDNQNTLLLDKDFSIGNSQSECSINVTQNNQRIESNIQLFNGQIEDRKKILKCNKLYEEKLTRSLSLFTIYENGENLLKNKTFKRTFSLQNLSEPSAASGLNNQFKEFICEKASEIHLTSNFSNKSILLNEPVKNFTAPNQCIFNSEFEKSDKLLLNKEINLRTMETVCESPVNISTPVENTNLHHEIVKENNGILPAENVITVSKNMFEAKIIISESVNSANINLNSETKESEVGLPSSNVNLHSDPIKNGDTVMHVDLPCETAKVSNGVLPAENIALCSNNASDEYAKIANKLLNVDNDKFAGLVTPVSSVSNSGTSSVKEVQANVVPVGGNIALSLNVPEVQTKVIPVGENITLNAQNNENISLYVQEEKLVLSSNLCNKNEANSFFVEEKLPPDNSTTAVNTNTDKCNSLEGSKPPVSLLEECNASNLNNVDNIVSESVAMVSVKNNDVNLHELCPNKSVALDIPAGELSISKEETVSKTENLDSGAEVNYMINDQKKCDPSKSANNNEGSFSKKRKLESRSKRSKRLKSEEKQNNFKIRSIKKVREIYYSVEEVKTMLDIMKQF